MEYVCEEEKSKRNLTLLAKQSVYKIVWQNRQISVQK